MSREQPSWAHRQDQETIEWLVEKLRRAIPYIEAGPVTVERDLLLDEIYGLFDGDDE